MKLLLAIAVMMMLAVTGYGQTNVLYQSYVTSSLCSTPTNWHDRISSSEITNAVKDLAAAGDICRVFGHGWRDGRPGEGGVFMFANLHPGTTFRTCKICRRCESKREEWK